MKIEESFVVVDCPVCHDRKKVYFRTLGSLAQVNGCDDASGAKACKTCQQTVFNQVLPSSPDTAG